MFVLILLFSYQHRVEYSFLYLDQRKYFFNRTSYENYFAKFAIIAHSLFVICQGWAVAMIFKNAILSVSFFYSYFGNIVCMKVYWFLNNLVDFELLLLFKTLRFSHFLVHKITSPLSLRVSKLSLSLFSTRVFDRLDKGIF